ncbi:MAG: hypothetical protein HY986_18075 [Candidatus Melainabacteria bacterium]|nr:hypothetical protein [Candidatus Melainabacteria bacterium]
MMENRNLSRFWKGLSVWATLRSRPASLILAVLAGASLLATPVQAQTYVPPGPGSDYDEFECVGVSIQYSGSSENTQGSVQSPPGPTTLVREQAEQNTDPVAQKVEAKLCPGSAKDASDENEMASFSYSSDFDVPSNVIVNICQLFFCLAKRYLDWCSSRIDVSSKPSLFSQSDPNFVSQWNSGKTLVMED